MIDETAVIADDEWLLRRIHTHHWGSPRAFEPRLPGPKVRDPDTTGISFYRQACLSDPADVLATVDPANWHAFGIVGISVASLKSLGLTVSPEPDSRINGHVVLPELRAELYGANKAAFAPLLLRLSELALQNVLRAPAAQN